MTEAIPVHEAARMLIDLRQRLDAVTEAFGLPRPAHTVDVLPAEDTRPRHQVWTDQLRDEPWFARWPTPLRERIVALVVETESNEIAEHLSNDNFLRANQRKPEWEWDADHAQLRRTEPDHQPDVEAYLARARQHIHQRQIEASVAVDWLSKMVEGDYPESVRAAAFTIWQAHGDAFRPPRPGAHARPDPLTEQVLELAQRVYPAGSDAPLWRPVDLIQGRETSPVALAFPTAVAAAVDAGGELEPDHTQPEPTEGPVR